jgi:purine-binding chemotaxis protein CheW
MASRQFCTFRLGEHFFGIDILQVQEIIRRLVFTRIPLAPSLIEGLVNLRGQIVTAIDMRLRLGLAPRESGKQPTHVVVSGEDGAFSLMVDEIGDMMQLSDEDLAATPDTIQGPTRELINGIYKLEGRLMLVLDVGKTTAIDMRSPA